MVADLGDVEQSHGGVSGDDGNEKEEDGDDGGLADWAPSHVYLPWIRWIVCVFGGVLLAVVAVTTLLYREPSDVLSGTPSPPPSSVSLGIGAEERAKERMRVAYTALLERIYLVFGPADPNLINDSSDRDDDGCWPGGLAIAGEDRLLFDAIAEALRRGAAPGRIRGAIKRAYGTSHCGDKQHCDMICRCTEPYAEAVVRLLHLRTVYPQSTIGALVDRMCRHGRALEGILPARLLVVADTAARSLPQISNLVAFYELRQIKLSLRTLLKKIVHVYKSEICGNRER